EVLGLVVLRLRADALGLLERRVLDRVVAACLGAVLRIVDLAEQSRMDDRDVIALQVVVDVDLPVAVEEPLLARGEAEAGVAALVEGLAEVAEEVAQRESAAIEIDED